MSMHRPRTFFTADTHFGHSRVLELSKRPFRDIRDQDQILVERWNEVVGHDDVIYHLGDFAYRADPERTADIFYRLNGREKHLIRGNHDHADVQNLPWTSVSNLTEIAVDARNIILCHYPLLEWRGYHRGAIHCFGHVHGNNPGVGRSCDVGVDCWGYRPASLEQVIARIEARS